PCVSPLLPYTTLFRSTGAVRFPRFTPPSGIGLEFVTGGMSHDQNERRLPPFRLHETHTDAKEVSNDEASAPAVGGPGNGNDPGIDRKSTRLNSSHVKI